MSGRLSASKTLALRIALSVCGLEVSSSLTCKIESSEISSFSKSMLASVINSGSLDDRLSLVKGEVSSWKDGISSIG